MENDPFFNLGVTIAKLSQENTQLKKDAQVLAELNKFIDINIAHEEEESPCHDAETAKLIFEGIKAKIEELQGERKR